MSKWKETQLYKALIAKHDCEYKRSIVTLLENPAVMDSIETILNSGGTTPKDFTLHDANHSYRVAEKMWEIIPNETKEHLTEYELGFLLLSAYLHDIGMSPTFDTVERHLKFLTTDDKKALAEKEIISLQKWIDNDNRAKSVDIRKESINDPAEYNYVLTYYIRSKHNDWSGDWIHDNLVEKTTGPRSTASAFQLKDYHNWQEDLILVCQSHHWGIDKLLNDEFDLRPVGSTHLHLRYLAMALRVADVMENDPERTPEVILQHRSISPSSVTYWLKDHQYTIERKDKTTFKYSIHARPDRAYLQKAIEETAKWVEDEFKLCEALCEEKPLDKNRHRKVEHYKWNIHSTLDKDIQPRANTYTYIQGGFRPNTAKILEMLGGNQLYGNSIWAFRELLQNAMDGVKESIAYQVLSQNGDAKELLNKYGELSSIKISLEQRDGDYYLICKDDGVGMTKEIIEKFFLESGSSKRYEIKELERRCKERGFMLGRTGQFGIGVLSYFMIADRIIVKTKRELNTGYADEKSIGWRFEINGTHDFGELKKVSGSLKGTEIELKLKKEISEEMETWDTKFFSFLKPNIQRSPCNIVYSSQLNANNNLTLHVGWTKTPSEIIQIRIDALSQALYERHKWRFDDDFSQTRVFTPTQKEDNLRFKKLIPEYIDAIRKSVAYIISEGEIESIKYRIIVPYFKLKEGNSLLFFKELIIGEQHCMRTDLGGDYYYDGEKYIVYSLKGIRTSTAGILPKQDIGCPILNSSVAYIEIDMENLDENNISISRNTLTLSKGWIDTLKKIEWKALSLLEDNISLFDNKYSALSNAVLSIVPKTHDYWLFSEDGEDIGFPVLKELKFPLANWRYELIKIGNTPLQKIDLLQNYIDRGHYKEFNWFQINKVDYTLGFTRIHGLSTVAMSYAASNSFTANGMEQISPPNGFEKILFYTDESDSFYCEYISIMHPSFATLEIEPLVHPFNPFMDLAELKTKGMCLRFLVGAINTYNDPEKWSALLDKISANINHVFKMLELSEIIILNSTGDIAVVTTDNWEYAENPHDYYPEEIDPAFILS